MTSPFALPTRRPSRAGRRGRAAGRDRQFGARARQAERLRTAVMHAALDAVLISDGQGHLVEVNEAAERMFGRPAAALLGCYMSDLIVAPAPGEGSVARLRGNILDMLGRRLALDGIRGDGTLFPAEIAVQRVSLGPSTLFAAFVRDLTGERVAAAALDEERQRLQQVEKLSAMGSLLAGVAHEINNPLAILVAQSALLCEKAPTEDVARRAERIHAAAQRAGRIVNGFLALARDKRLPREQADLRELLDGALELLGYGLRSAGVAVERRDRPALPPVACDRDLIGQAFASLLINAQEAVLRRPAGRRIVLRSGATDCTVTVEVEDNGGGVAPAIAARLFEPYVTTKPAGTGLGIGLSLCRSVVESHGGTLGWRNEGEGAVFTVTLPRAAPAPGAPRPGPAQARGRRLAVLVVDDEVDVAQSLAELIELFGHTVCVETAAAEVPALLRAQRFDMVFTDFRMPALDGVALRRAIAAFDPDLAARTVLMTGDTVQRAARTLAGDPDMLVLDKPFTAAGVKALLDQVASR